MSPKLPVNNAQTISDFLNLNKDGISEKSSEDSSKFAFDDAAFLARRETLGIRFELELLKPEILLREWGIEHTITVFGSTRFISLEQALALEKTANTPEEIAQAKKAVLHSKYYESAREFGKLVATYNATQSQANNKLHICTGGGPGIMEAANRGAFEAGDQTIGFNISLPREQHPNPFISERRIVISKDGEVAPAQLENKKFKSEPSKGIYVYDLRKFLKTNSSTCFNQRPLVRRGDKVKQGDIIADGAATDKGELALGRNVLVGFMPWNGYNFEDAILLSERMLKDDVFTSVHIEEFEVTARDTKLGPEQITRDIPNLGEEALRNLNRDGVIRIGAEVKPDDILVGKITPKSEGDLAPEEKLLRAIFGEKARDVKDTSLRVPSGISGIIMDVKVSSRTDKDDGRLSPNDQRRALKKVNEEYRTADSRLREEMTESLSNILLGEKIPLDVKNSETGEAIIPANRKITKTLLRRLASVSRSIEMNDSPVKQKIRQIVDGYHRRFDELEQERARKVEAIEQGIDEGGAIKNVKVYIATKRKIQVGDKMAGRHGNKGVVARIVPVEDMPYLSDGTPVDICLNPLGVPSRMNVGQVLETHLGWACSKLGLKMATPIFDGIPEKQIREYLKQAELPETGKAMLVNGHTGEAFDQDVVVGYIYMMKLNHLVADKIHARATGPYSLITQQPLGGKAQYGGQRFGEMEVWALEAYGAAYTLQELLTVKSDDVAGRTKIYEQLVKGDNTLVSGTPQSFNVLMKEMQALCLDVRLGTGTGTPDRN